VDVKFLTLFTLLECVSGAFGQPNGSVQDRRFSWMASPAIAASCNAGLPLEELDLDGSPRVKSGKIDIGCYQTK
jgi:hypothetical protein